MLADLEKIAYLSEISAALKRYVLYIALTVLQ